MEKDIYTLLNEVTTDLNDYKKEQLTEMEQKKMMKKFTAKREKKNSNYKKYVAVASLAVISFGAIGSIPTFASTNPTMYKLANIMGINKDLDSYTTAINKPVTDGDITMELGEVLYDKENNKLKFVTVISSDEKVIEGKHWSTFSRIYINGEQINVASYYETKVIDENKVAIVAEYLLDESYDGVMDIKIVNNMVEVNDEVKKGKWDFEFTTDGTQLASDTNVISINKEIELDKETKFVIEKYTQNDLNEYLIMFKGKDNLVNEVIFDFYFGNTYQGGEYRLNKEKSNLSPEATSITLDVYALELPKEGGSITNDYEKVGDSFTIELGK